MAGKDNYFQRPTTRLYEIMQERGIEIPASNDEAESSDQSPGEESVSYTSILAPSPALTEMRSV